jgi:hypothetical protein
MKLDKKGTTIPRLTDCNFIIDKIAAAGDRASFSRPINGPRE